MRKLIAFLLIGSCLTAATINVPADYPTIQEGIDAAADGDTVLLAAGEYEVASPVNFTGKAITLESKAGSKETTISMSREPVDPTRSSVVIFESSEDERTVLKGFTLTGGSGTSPSIMEARTGGGVFCNNDSSPTLTDCIITGNSGNRGGGICSVAGSSPTVIDCIITRNSSTGGGGVCCQGNSSPTMNSCIITDNWAGEDEGGGVYCAYDSSPTLMDCTITDNNANKRGGGIYCISNASPILTNCIIGTNAVETEGGGIYCNGDSSPTLTGCIITGNTAMHAAGIYCRDSSPAMTACTFTDNSGGALFCDLRSSPTLMNCTINGNFGGVACDDESSPTLLNCTITGNTANRGGALFCMLGSSPTLTNCLIAGNWAKEGGGVWCWNASPTFTNCTFTENFAEDTGGSFFCDRYSCPILRNCIIWHNINGSIYLNDDDSIPNITFSCIEGHSIWPGEGNINSDPRFVQTGYWDDNSTPDDIEDDVWIEGNYQLPLNSPCIDAGTMEEAPDKDISGIGRPCIYGIDIGAFEYCDTLFLRGDPNADQHHDLADAIFILTYLFADGPAPQCLDAADANDSGKIDLADAIRVLDYLFNNSLDLPAPFSDCGIDITPDDINCAISTCVAYHMP